jgi:hypothetical protein
MGGCWPSLPQSNNPSEPRVSSTLPRASKRARKNSCQILWVNWLAKGEHWKASPVNWKKTTLSLWTSICNSIRSNRRPDSTDTSSPLIRGPGRSWVAWRTTKGHYSLELQRTCWLPPLSTGRRAPWTRDSFSNFHLSGQGGRQWEGLRLTWSPSGPDSPGFQGSANLSPLWIQPQILTDSWTTHLNTNKRRRE